MRSEEAEEAHKWLMRSFGVMTRRRSVGFRMGSVHARPMFELIDDDDDSIPYRYGRYRYRYSAADYTPCEHCWLAHATIQQTSLHNHVCAGRVRECQR